MLNKMRNIFYLLICTIVLASCAVHSGLMMNSAALSQNNFKIIGNVTGTSKTTLFLGIGGLKKEGLALEAKKNMKAQYQLKNGQAYANVTVDIKRTFWILGVTNKCTINADIVQFLETGFYRADTSEILPVIPQNKNTVEINRSEKYNHQLGDIVFFYNEENETVAGKIIMLEDSAVTLQYTGKNGDALIKTLPYSKIRNNK
jgi:hypothetical protein